MSAAWPIDVAVAAAITGDVTLAALLAGDKVYSLVAKKNAPFDYIVLGDSPESQFRTFGRGGHANSLTVHLWSQKTQKKGPLTMYDNIERIFDNKPLVISGHTRVSTSTRLITVLADPDGVTFHGVASIDVLSMVG